MRRSPLGRSMARMYGNNNGNYGVFWGLLLHHNLLLLLQPLHHYNQCLDLLFQDGKDVMLDNWWSKWRSKQLRCLVRWLFIMRRTSGVANIDVLCLHLYLCHLYNSRILKMLDLTLPSWRASLLLANHFLTYLQQCLRIYQSSSIRKGCCYWFLSNKDM